MKTILSPVNVKTNHPLNHPVSHLHGRRVEGFEHDLRHLFAIGFGIEGRLGQQDWMLFGCDAKLVVKGVMPNLLHIVPVGDDSMLDRVLERQNTCRLKSRWNEILQTGFGSAKFDSAKVNSRFLVPVENPE